MEKIHDRMPVILPAAACDRWLSAEPLDEDAMKQMCAPYPATDMQAFAISPLVNSPKNDSAEILERA